MRFKQYLKEKYFKGFEEKLHGETDTYWEIFINPSKKELRDAGGKDRTVRFFVDMKKKEVYVWYWKMTHYQISGRIFGAKLNYWHSPNPDMIMGVAKQQGGKWIMTGSDIGTQHNIKKHGIKLWKWADKYINVTDYMKKKAEEEYKGDIDWEFLGRTEYGEMA